MGRTKIARTIYIDNEQIEALKRLSQRTKVPQSVYVREALDMLLEKYSEQLQFDFKSPSKSLRESQLSEGKE
ncbi:MAG: ribbon-helix-helix domain-containing protein [Thermodesulfobacteriota bacterium]